MAVCFGPDNSPDRDRALVVSFNHNWQPGQVSYITGRELALSRWCSCVPPQTSALVVLPV